MIKTISLTSALHDINLDQKRVFVRADLNVDLLNGTILNDYRLQAILPTLDLIIKKGGKIILASHMGRPKKADPALSTRQLIPWFEKQGYDIEFQASLEKAQEKSKQEWNRILLLENLRFYPGEKNNDTAFANSLARLADYYVLDAFGTLHRPDTSVTLLAEKFSPAHRTVGLLIEKELAKLNGILEHPKKPFMLIIGGGKVGDKLPILANLLELVDCIALGPAIVFTFLKAQNKEVGLSLVQDEQIADCKAILSAAQEKKVRILFPVDYQIALDTFKGPLTNVSADNFPANGVGISVGPKTQELWNTEIMHAGTILYNGLMGDPTRPETLHGSAALITAMSQSPGFSLLAGGNTVGAAQQLNLSQSIDYLSTGGGATLAYLSGMDLPGLKAFI